MLRKFFGVLAALAIFLAGAYAEDRFQVTPPATAVFRTFKMLLGDLYAGVISRVPSEIDSTSALVALGGFLALLSLRYLARARRM